jgi:membrane-associated phospholipid phosphatase
MKIKIPFSKLVYRILLNIWESIIYNYGLNYLLAGGLTYIIVQSGWDWAWYSFSVSHQTLFKAAFSAAGLGFLVPVAVPLWLYVSGRVKKNTKRQIMGLALGQAAILGLAISSFIKFFTGRIPPPLFSSFVNVSNGFRFGLDRGGTFNGWPSSHTAVAFSMAIALIQFYPNNKWVKFGAWFFALCIGLGVSLNIHWLSDAVAGAFIGYAIGKSVGVSFKKLL